MELLILIAFLGFIAWFVVKMAGNEKR